MNCFSLYVDISQTRFIDLLPALDFGRVSNNNITLDFRDNIMDKYTYVEKKGHIG